jgi:CRP-like cAMP-binding protein
LDLEHVADRDFGRITHHRQRHLALVAERRECAPAWLQAIGTAYARTKQFTKPPAGIVDAARQRLAAAASDETGAHVLYQADQKIDRVYFPTAGFISLVVGLPTALWSKRAWLESTVSWAPGPLDGRAGINQAIVQAPRSSLTIDAEVLAKLVSENDTLRAALMRHELVSYALTQQIAACNARHELDERLCRWLMQTRDLLESDTLPLTQEFLAQMLGVQRSSVRS